MCSQQRLHIKFMRADKRDYRVVSLPAMWWESFKDNKPFKCKINSFIDKLAMVKMILKKWVQYNIKLQIINYALSLVFHGKVTK